jgi:hypothetical protein
MRKSGNRKSALTRSLPPSASLIASTIDDPTSSMRLPAAVRGLERIAATVDTVDYNTLCNLANVNEAMRGALLDVLGVHLMSVGQGPTLDYADASFAHSRRLSTSNASQTPLGISAGTSAAVPEVPPAKRRGDGWEPYLSGSRVVSRPP